MGQLSQHIMQEIQNSSYLPSSLLLKGRLLSAVYCSDLRRAMKSAELIAKPHSLNPVIVPSLRERNFEIWEGISFDEIKRKYPEVLIFRRLSMNSLKRRLLLCTYCGHYFSFFS
jgi:bisphosphoglycerate-dependent phosphoglycerate mutase